MSLFCSSYTSLSTLESHAIIILPIFIQLVWGLFAVSFSRFVYFGISFLVEQQVYALPIEFFLKFFRNNSHWQICISDNPGVYREFSVTELFKTFFFPKVKILEFCLYLNKRNLSRNIHTYPTSLPETHSCTSSKYNMGKQNVTKMHFFVPWGRTFLNECIV